MRRREFITLIGGAATTLSLAARAQDAEKRPTIGFLGADAAGWRLWTDAFVIRLRELGWIEGRTIAIKYRWSEGHPERVAPNLRRLAILFNAGYPASVLEAGEVQAAGRAIGLEVAPHEIRRREDCARLRGS